MRSILLFVVAFGVALCGGFGSLWYAIRHQEGVGAFVSGSWVTYPEIGTVEADPYSKARSALGGLLVLGRNEGIAFVAERDGTGDPLSRRCRYVIDGAMPTARFWTLYASTLDDMPIGGRSSLLNTFNVVFRQDSNLTISVGATPIPGNWLRVQGEGAMRLVLTLYDTPAVSHPSIADVVLPSIAKAGCDD